MRYQSKEHAPPRKKYILFLAIIPVILSLILWTNLVKTTKNKPAKTNFLNENTFMYDTEKTIEELEAKLKIPNMRTSTKDEIKANISALRSQISNARTIIKIQEGRYDRQKKTTD